jgi:hypothetical protein
VPKRHLEESVLLESARRELKRRTPLRLPWEQGLMSTLLEPRPSVHDIFKTEIFDMGMPPMIPEIADAVPVVY